MIERLVGTCAWRLPNGIILDVNGVGYGLEMPERSLSKLAVLGTSLELWVHTHVREDALKLYGFVTYEEKLLFGLFLSISGVGPKLAMAMLSHLDAAMVLQAVQMDDAHVLEEVPGIGARQSKKILLEIKPKLEKMQASGLLLNMELGKTGTLGFFDGSVPNKKSFSPVLLEDLHSALNNFGYKEKEFLPVIKRLERDRPAAQLPELIRLALAELSGAGRKLETRQEPEDLF